MPKDNIERAIAKGAGEGADGDAFEAIVYEGYGPEGVAVIVEALTDNRNRTASEVRHIFAKFGGNLGTTGRGRLAVRAPRASCSSRPTASTRTSSSWPPPTEAPTTSSRTATSSRSRARPRASRPCARRSRAPGFTIESAELSMLPKTTVAVDDEGKAKQLMRLIDALEDNDDVQEVYANFDIPEQVLEAATV